MSDKCENCIKADVCKYAEMEGKVIYCVYQTEPRTNFERITQNIDSFIEWINKNFDNMTPNEMPCTAEGDCYGDCNECFKKWLQEEVENEQ